MTLRTEVRKTAHILLKARAESLAGPGNISRHTLVPLYRAAYFTTVSLSSLVLHTCRENIATTGRLKNCGWEGRGQIKGGRKKMRNGMRKKTNEEARKWDGE